MNGKKIIRTKKKCNINKIISKVKNNIIKAINNFKKLDDLHKKIIIMWGAILLIVLLICVSCKINKKITDKYLIVESNMTEAAEKYAQEKQLYPTEASPLIVTLDVLTDYNYLNNDDIDESCQGYSKIIYNDIEEKYHTNSYITCRKYTTEGYSNNK